MEKTADPTEISDTKTDEPISEDYPREFILPKKIRLVKVLIAIIINFIIAAVALSISIYYFIDPPIDKGYIKAIAVFLILFGAYLLIQFPIIMIRTLNSKLILGEEIIKVRNAFNWKIVYWKDLQEILITEKLTKDLADTDIIGIGLVRFRTVTKNIYFDGDSYPIYNAELIIDSCRKAFTDFLENSDYKVNERIERPSIRSRIRYYEKTIRNSFNTE
ncbi:MAG: hypothetical protein FK734_07610 [Asgard group archaeon]|nr:hypothetical protein [Asgard group archaeon]